MKIAKIDQLDRQEFLNWRMKGVGASDVAMILGCSPYGNRKDLLDQKVSGEGAEINPFLAKRGYQVETVARAYVELQYGMSFEPLCIYDESKPHRLASLDGYNANAKLTMEAKYVGAKIFTEVNTWADVMQKMEHYYCQVQWQLIIANNAEYCLFVMVDSKNNKKIIQIHIDAEYIQKMAMITLVDEFWKEVEAKRGGKAPVIKEQAQVIEEKKEIRRINDENLSVLLEKRAELNTKIKGMTEELKMIEDNIKATDAFKEKSSFICGQHSVMLVERMGAVDYKKIPELNDVNLEEYRKKPSTYWKFL